MGSEGRFKWLNRRISENVGRRHINQKSPDEQMEDEGAKHWKMSRGGRQDCFIFFYFFFKRFGGNQQGINYKIQQSVRDGMKA